VSSAGGQYYSTSKIGASCWPTEPRASASGLSLGPAPAVLISRHVDAWAAKADALQFEPHPLLDRLFTRRTDCSAGADHSVPGQSSIRAEGPDYLPRPPRKTGRRRHLSVSGHFSARNLANGVGEDFQSRRHMQTARLTRAVQSKRRACLTTVALRSRPSAGSPRSLHQARTFAREPRSPAPAGWQR